MSSRILLKSDEKTDPKYGCPPAERSIEDHIRRGVVNIDKPSGPSSHQVTEWARGILELEKAGHSGTLDPKVTGVLPVTLENSTRVVRTLLLSSKEYICVMMLHKEIPKSMVREIFKEFVGEIYQRPPVKSAVRRRLRTRNIYELELLEKDGNAVLFRVRCEAGTYIRKLCHDIGLVLNTGGHMQELRRTKAGPFDESTLVILHDLIDAWKFYKEDGDEKLLRKLVQPVENAVRHMKSIWIKDGAVDAVCHGANLNAPGVSKLSEGIMKDELVALFTLKDELVAIGNSRQDSEEIMKMKRGLVVNLERVVMKTDTYPRMWHPK